MASTMMIANGRISLVIFSTIIFLILMDASLARTFQFTSRSEYDSIVIFMVMAFFYSIGQFLISVYIKKKTIKLAQKQRRIFRMLVRIIVFAQYISIVIVVVVLIQLLIVSKYNTLFLELSIWLNYGSGNFSDTTLILLLYDLV